MTSPRQSAMVFALSLMLAFLSAEGVSMQEKVLSRSGQDLKVQTSSKVAADWAGNEDNEKDDDDDDDDDDNDDDAGESEKAAAAAAAAEKASAADAENAAEAALVQTAKPQPPSAAEKAAAEAERAAEVTEMQTTKPKKALVQYAKHTHHHHKHHEVDQQILVPPQASPAPALPFPLGQQPIPLPPSFAPAPALRALTPSQLAKERALAKKEDELEGKITPHAVEQARLSKNVMMLEQELHANLQEQSELKQRIEYLSSERRSDQDIEASVERVANETDSFAMANMLGRMWKEMRMFDVPMYAEHVAEKLRQLEKDQHKLEAKLAKTEGKLTPAEAPAKKTLGGEALAPIAEHVEDALAPKAGAPVTEHPGYRAPRRLVPQLNFWAMSTGDQEYSLAYSIVYLVAGVALAFIFNKVRSSKPQLLTVAEKSGTLPNSSDFSFSIFGCFDALNADGMPWPCLMGCFCPSLRWAHTVDGQGLLPYWKAFFAFFFLTALHSYSYGVSSILVVGLGVVYRQKLRQKYHIEGGTKSVAMDILVWLCCQPCAIIQEAREESVLRSGGADSSYSGP